MTDSATVLDGPTTATNYCKTCSTSKSIQEFYLNNGRPRSICKSCHAVACAARNRAKRKGNRVLTLGDRLAARRHSYPPIKLREAAITPLMLPLTELKFNQCHYPYDAPDGSGVSFLFCGHPKAEGNTPYCKLHHQLTHRQDQLSPIRVASRWR